MIPRQSVDIARILLVIVMLLALMIGSLYVLRPFLPGLIWATTIVVATWPVLLSIQRHCGGRRWLATVAMLLILLFVIVLPLYQAISTLALHGGTIMAAVKRLPDYALLAPPSWVRGIPLAGPRIAQEWQALSDAGAGGLLARIEPYLTTAAHWLLGHAAIVGVFVMHMLITVIIAGILYSKGDAAADFALRFSNRLAGPRGVAAIKLAASAIRAVALGIVVTAVVQSALGGIGLWIAGVPAAGILTALMVMLCLAQLGPFLPMLGGVAWLFQNDMKLAAAVLLVWAIVVGTLDNLLRPLLIKRGVNLSMLLILSGVLGGMFAFGIVGLFIGPVILAVTSTLLKAWIDEVPPPVQAGAQAPDLEPEPPEGLGQKRA
ncbi:AI-2E family transporter YdiK [Achromobacter mucicolens]|uniref:AI-2E family transporter YdiK n=1 Tax=Achromobacter mucicolens TaxID=1389922 RepID=A0ABD4YQK4_9BURK|nr:MULTISPECIES: AI-2E family transporter YdiK [Achromobacter]MDH1177695.1 AI-2E family transporter YdiK [Achromobacter mucicolens]